MSLHSFIPTFPISAPRSEMIQVKCPQCSTVLTATPGEEAHCTNCGFRALVPATGAGAILPAVGPSSSLPPPPSEESMGPAEPANKVLSVWAYLAAMASVGTFFLAGIGIPFLFGLAGVGLAAASFLQHKEDKRGLLAGVISVFGILLSTGYFFLA